MRPTLVLLKCPYCKSSIKTLDTDKVFFCLNCNIAFELNTNEEDSNSDSIEESKIPISFAEPLLSDKSNSKLIYLPFWRINTIITRIDKGSGRIHYVFNNKGSIIDDSKSKDIKPIDIFVPAYSTDNFEFSALLTRKYIQEGEQKLKLSTDKKIKMCGATVSSKSSIELAELIVLYLYEQRAEQDKKFFIEDLNQICFEFTTTIFTMIGFPFDLQGDSLLELVYGLSIKTSNVLQYSEISNRQLSIG